MQLFLLETLDLFRQFLAWFIRTHEILFNRDLAEDDEGTYSVARLLAPFGIYFAAFSTYLPLTYAAFQAAVLYGLLGVGMSLMYRTGAAAPSLVVDALFPTRSRIYLIYTFRLMGVLAKSDGLVTDAEIGRVSEYMDKQLHLDDANRLMAIAAFRTGTRTLGSAEFYGLKLRLLLSDRKPILLGIRAMLIDLALVDGRLSSAEKLVIDSACAALHVPRPEPRDYERRGGRADFSYARPERESRRTKASEPGSPPSRDPYFLLGVRRDADEKELKRRYRKLCREYHPDTGIAKGLPKQYVTQMAEQFKTVQQAWQQICDERKIK